MSIAAWPIRVGTWSWRLPVRAAVIATLAAAALITLVVADLSLGEIDIPVGEIVAALTGHGSTSTHFVIMELRLPQTLVAAMVGTALGVSGALTQTFARNPLASPDILGVTNGASAGAVAVIVLSGASGYRGGLVSGALQTVGIPLVAFAGGLATAALLYVLSWRRGISGGRLVLIGIGVGATLDALISWLMVHARIEDAASATIWLNGSLTNRGWDQALPLVVALVALLPLTWLTIPTLNALQLGDDTARGLGVGLQRTQLLVLVLAVALAAVAVSAAGPIDFVAFVVPQIAVRLVRGSRPPLLASALLGGALVVGADLLTRVVLPIALPAGLVTSALGAPYLIYVLLRANRKVTA